MPLTIEQKQRRDYVSIECLAMLHNNKAASLRQFITIDETWVHHLTPKTEEQSKQWTFVVTIAKINELKIKLLPHAPYSPDSDYFLFPNLKK